MAYISNSGGGPQRATPQRSTWSPLVGAALITAAALAAAHWWRAPVPVRPPNSLAIRPGAKPAAGRTIRVRLTDPPVSRLTVEVSGAYRVVEIASRKTIGEGPQLAATRFDTAGGKLRWGERVSPGSGVEIVPASGGVVWCEQHAYRGTLRISATADNRLLAVNYVPLESYIASVVDSEMPLAFGREARKAQAIVARSYALWQMRTANPAAGYDVFASTRSQRYLGFQYYDSGGRKLAGETDDGRRIATETAGVVCSYRGQLFCPYYSAACGGRTMRGTEIFPDAAAAPLQSVVCRWCQPATLYRWDVTISRQAASERLRNHFSKQGWPFGSIRALGLAETPQAGRLNQFLVRDERRTGRISGQELRTVLGGGIHSPSFEIEVGRANLIVHGRGSGHGCGLCQWGAKGLAADGHSAQAILAFYYPGSKLEMLDRL